MTYPAPPLSDAQRDALVRTLTRQVSDAEVALREAAATITELRGELVAVSMENAALKAGLVPEHPFGR